MFLDRNAKRTLREARTCIKFCKTRVEYNISSQTGEKWEIPEHQAKDPDLSAVALETLPFLEKYQGCVYSTLAFLLAGSSSSATGLNQSKVSSSWFPSSAA
mmetsp:Transcript_17/g.38  ORF Transcript_17/g.38 Transcript_17/m.38 type:complete len:101 (-) Transcript_17:517-819(-)